jgi:transcriptional regulator with XRE-family HTH domain
MATNQHRQAGKLVRDLRSDRGWTHEDMSAAIFNQFGAQYATSARTIWRVESGHKPSVRKQFAIARILDTMPSKLWGSGTQVQVAA